MKKTLISSVLFLILTSCAGESQTIRFCETNQDGTLSTKSEAKLSPTESTNKGKNIWIQANHNFTYSLIDDNGDVVEIKDCLNR